MNDGITRRDLFIAAALQGLLAHHGIDTLQEEHLVDAAFRLGLRTNLRVLEDMNEDSKRLARAHAIVLEQVRAEKEKPAPAPTGFNATGAVPPWQQPSPRWATPPAPSLPGNEPATPG